MTEVCFVLIYSHQQTKTKAEGEVYENRDERNRVEAHSLSEQSLKKKHMKHTPLIKSGAPAC